MELTLRLMESIPETAKSVPQTLPVLRSGSKANTTSDGRSIESRCASFRLYDKPSLHGRLGRAEPQLCR